MPGPVATVTMLDPSTGRAHDIPAEQLDVYRNMGFVPESPDQRNTRLGSEVAEQLYGGAGGAVKAGAAGLARGITLGGSDALASALGGEDTAIALEGYREHHPYTSFGSEVVGAILPTVLSGGAAAEAEAPSLAAAAGRLLARTPAGLVARAGEAAGARLGGGLLGVAGTGALEGSLYGVGEGVSQLSLSQDPLTVERAASVISSNALYGAGAGAAAGVVTKGVASGLRRAKQAIDSALLARSEGRAMAAVGELEAAAAAEPAAITPETDVATLDRKGLKVARDQELEAVRAAQQPERAAFIDDLQASRDAAKEEKSWIATQGGKTREVREIGKLTLEADQRVDRLLKNPIELEESPGKALSALRQQEHALTQLREWGENEVQRYLDARAAAPDAIRAELMSNKLPGFVVGKGGISPTSPVLDDIVAREFQARYPKGDALPTNLQVLNTVPGALERNKALQDRLAKLAEAPTSPRLAAIDTAEGALGGRTAPPKPEAAPSLGHQLLSAVAPFAGPVGAVAQHGSRAIEGLRKAAGIVAERGGQAASRFLDVTAKATSKAAPYAPAVATKVLAAVRFADEERRQGEPKPAGPKLNELFQARADEVKSQVQIAPDGSFQMRPAARAKMAAKFDGIRPIDPMLADRLETMGARRIEYLASLLPRRPDYGTIRIGPDRWVPPELAVRAWARAVAALEDPHAVLEHAAAGRVTPEAAAAIRAVYPEMLAAFTATVSAKLPELRRTLPYNRRLSLSILTGVPVDPAMTPSILRVIQGMYRSEPGTAGGTQAPIAQPQFGSVKRIDPGTPAQRREGLIPT